MSLADAIAELERKPPPPMSITSHPQSFGFLAEGYERQRLGDLGYRQHQEREALEAKHQRQREKAAPAA